MPANNKQQDGHRAPQALVLTGIALTTVAYFLFTLHDDGLAHACVDLVLGKHDRANVEPVKQAQRDAPLSRIDQKRTVPVLPQKRWQ